MAAIDLDARKVMKRMPTLADQAQDAIESAGASRNLHRRSGRQPESAEPGDECEIERLVSLVVRDV
jgi:hypothetical protein